MSRKVIELELPLELPDGSEIQIQAECEVTYNPEVGADADGNRGMPGYFTGPVVIKNMTQVVQAIEAAAEECSDEFIEAFEEEEEDYDPDEDEDDEDEKPSWLQA